MYSTFGNLVLEAREGEPSFVKRLNMCLGFVPRRREIHLKRVTERLSNVRKINNGAQKEQEISLFQFLKFIILLLIPHDMKQKGFLENKGRIRSTYSISMVRGRTNGLKKSHIWSKWHLKRKMVDRFYIQK